MDGEQRCHPSICPSVVGEGEYRIGGTIFGRDLPLTTLVRDSTGCEPVESLLLQELRNDLGDEQQGL